MGKLVLSVRECDESIVVKINETEEVTVMVARQKGKRVELAIDAPRRCKITRERRDTPVAPPADGGVSQ